MNISTFKIFLITILALASSGNAQDHKPRQAFGEKHGEKQDPISRFDQNQDGMLSQEEFQASPKLSSLAPEQITPLFNRLDKNSDGFISRTELPKPQLGERKGMGPREGLRERLRAMDINQDRRITREEFFNSSPHGGRAIPQERKEQLFKMLDGNEDGVITPDDRPKAGPLNKQRGEKENRRPLDPAKMEDRFQRLDANMDGEVTKEEFLAERKAHITAEQAEKIFARLDANSDGVINSLDREARPPRPEKRPNGPKRPFGQ